jgi:hypothetical protein
LITVDHPLDISQHVLETEKQSPFLKVSHKLLVGKNPLLDKHMFRMPAWELKWVSQLTANWLNCYDHPPHTKEGQLTNSICCQSWIGEGVLVSDL